MESKGGGVVAEQVRRVHIIYFLSRMGQIEHPHLLRVHHSSRNGVHLRDVKRWLSDLRGKDMPDNFCWSYKRKYKAGYVWQDLLDDDLITPVSDNEYVLKGSEICANPFDSYLCPEKKVQTQIPDPIEEKKPPTEAKPENPVTLVIDNSAKITEIDQEDSGPFDSETSTVTEDSIKANAAYIFKLDNDSHSKSKPESEIVEIPTSPCALKKNKENKKNKKEEEEEEEEEEENKPTKPKTGTTKSESFSFPKSKSYSSGASNVFRNLLKCGAIETKDSTMMMINKVDKTSKKPLDEQPLLEVGSGSQRISGSAWNQQQPYSSNSRKNSNGGKSSKKKKNELSNKKTTSAVFKPVTEPNCSQCGKTFKPEKMHTHMKSCRGLKSFSKSGITAAVVATAAEKVPSSSSQRSSDASSNEGISGYFLTR